MFLHLQIASQQVLILSIPLYKHLNYRMPTIISHGFVNTHTLWTSPEKILDLYQHYHKKTDQNNSELTFYLESDRYYYNDLQITQEKIDSVIESHTI